MLKVQTLVVGMVSTNCYIVYDPEAREAAVVDPGDKADAIIDAVRGNALTVKYVLLTHGHFDHVLALDGVRGAFGAKAVIHEADADYLRDPDLSGRFGRLRASTDADILVRGGETFSLGRYAIEVLHTPGHTPGSVCYRANGLLFTGDTLFEGDCGRCDFPGGDYGEMLKSLRCLAELEGDCTVYPGHDVSTTLSRERKHNANMLQALR
jgi:glyoxylase-like metal-dependent hydrolase (beta-lactamase superfamily II)